MLFSIPVQPLPDLLYAWNDISDGDETAILEPDLYPDPILRPFGCDAALAEVVRPSWKRGEHDALP